MNTNLKLYHPYTGLSLDYCTGFLLPTERCAEYMVTPNGYLLVWTQHKLATGQILKYGDFMQVKPLSVLETPTTSIYHVSENKYGMLQIVLYSGRQINIICTNMTMDTQQMIERTIPCDTLSRVVSVLQGPGGFSLMGIDNSGSSVHMMDSSINVIREFNCIGMSEHPCGMVYTDKQSRRIFNNGGFTDNPIGHITNIIGNSIIDINGDRYNLQNGVVEEADCHNLLYIDAKSYIYIDKFGVCKIFTNDCVTIITQPPPRVTIVTGIYSALGFVKKTTSFTDLMVIFENDTVCHKE